MKVLMLLSVLASCRAAITPQPTENYPHRAVLDPDEDYHLFWKHEGGYITFEVHVKTMGWIGFGLSESGGMNGADIVVAWIDSTGQAHFHDTHSQNVGRPTVDTEANWYLSEAKQTSGVTMVKFYRHTTSCDSSGQDMHIEDGTHRLIYAHGPQVPTSFNQLMKHAANRRGTLSVRLLESGSQGTNVPSDATTVDFKMNNLKIPTTDTTYWCQFFKFPSLPSKHHIVKLEPLITPGHERLVHHVLLYACPLNTNLSLVGVNERCYTGNMPEHECEELFGAWAIGGTAQHYPDHVGYPVGDASGPHVILMEMHYDNPQRWNNYSDSSGMRLHVTPTLRQHDAGVLFTGHFSSPALLIPPLVPNYNVDSWCPSQCLTNAMSGVAPKINVFGSVLHAHLLGRKIAARIVRNGEEVANAGVDDHYDFNFQEFHTLKQEIELSPGDTIFTECQMDSSNRNRVTYGGLGTSEEMCLSFLWYYPRIPLSQCVVGSNAVGLMRLFGAHNVTYRGREAVVDHPIHLQNKTAADLVHMMDWGNSSLKNTYISGVRDSEYDAYCGYTDRQPYFERSISKPSYNRAPPPATPERCSVTQGSGQLHASFVTLILSVFLLISFS